MELPLSISNLQEQWLLSFLKKLDPANITELFWQLRPYVVLHHVEFKESSFSFSSITEALVSKVPLLLIL